MNYEQTRLLQAARLKGRATTPDLAAAAGLTEDDVTTRVQALLSAGEVEEVRGRYKLTPAGRAGLDALLAAERTQVDAAALATAYHSFDEHNAALKGLMTRWQLKDEATPNDHTDPGYDAAVVADLVVLDAAFAPLLGHLVALAPRLGHYPTRFAAALEKIRGGDHSWFARPLVDSYHTVWFELHEELIGLAGLNRVDEAVAGRAE